MPALLDGLFTTPAVADALSDRARLQGMLDFEAALARAEARLGIIPERAAGPIAAACRAELYDAGTLSEAAASAGNLAIPLVKRLTEAVRKTDEQAARYVHWGATSQDAIDTGLVLQLRMALAALDLDLARLTVALAMQARRHAATPMVGRTWLQHATPVTFGLKAAGWLDAVLRCREGLAEAGRAAQVLQFGGASGTLAALGGRGLEVAAALARELSLAEPLLPWHGARDRLAAVGACLGLVAGTMGKIARDLSLLMQTELGEAAEPSGAGRGGSSTMPHKRNPVGCAVALSAATRVPGLVATLFAAMPQEHERGLGGWHAEWETLPEILRLAAGAVHAMAGAMEGLTVDAGRMRENLDATRGLIMAEALTMALGDRIGRGEAHRLVEQAARRAVEAGLSLKEAVAGDGALSSHFQAGELDRLLDPEQYLGSAAAMVARVLDHAPEES